MRLVIVGMEEDTENPWEKNFRKGAQMETRFLDLKKKPCDIKEFSNGRQKDCESAQKNNILLIIFCFEVGIKLLTPSTADLNSPWREKLYRMQQ